MEKRSLGAVRPPTARRYAARACIAVGLIALAYAAASGYLWISQRTLIFQPSAALERTPASLGLRYEDVRIAVPRAPGAVLHGWWIPSADVSAPVLLYLHGNDLNIGGNLSRIASLNRIGFTLLAIDYRGYGGSSAGPPSETLVYEDAEAAWQYLVEDRRLDARRIFIYGHSLGGAIALELALRHPEAGGVIVESTFTSMAALARTVYPMFPTDWLLNQRFDSLAKVGKLEIPVLFIHGTADAEVPSGMSEELYAAAHEPKRLVLIAGAGHEDSIDIDAVAYESAMRAFTREAQR